MKQVYNLNAAFQTGFIPGQFNNLIRTLLFTLVLAVGSTVVSAQLTIKVSSLPGNTPAGATFYATGTFNNWNPADPSKRLTALGNGKYALTFFPAPGIIEFKITRGSWETVEGGVNGAFQLNHTIAYNGQPKTIEFDIHSWPDLINTGGGNNQMTGGVQVMDEEFFIPELNRTRRVWVYLPKDYGTAVGKYYPVVYMQDGQDLFDESTSFDGEWGVDETMDQLFENGDPGCIIVGIDNGGVHRSDEYSPWENPQYGGGEGDDYLHFIIHTLKPYIDQNFRSIPDRNHTGIIGSNMGGLISMYALIEFQDVFSKAGVFSPSFWFVGNKMEEHIDLIGKEQNVKVYFLTGGLEPQYIHNDVENIWISLQDNGFNHQEMNQANPADGEHAAWFWGREFGAAYQWLFADAQAINTVDASDIFSTPETLQLSVFPNPSTDWVKVSNVDGWEYETVQVQVVDMQGRVVLQAQQNANEAVYTADLERGAYALRIQREDGDWAVAQFIHE